VAKRKRDKPLKIDLDFHDALRVILKAKPLPKKRTTKRPTKQT